MDKIKYFAVLIISFYSLFFNFRNLKAQEISVEMLYHNLNSPKHDTIKIMAMYYLYMHYAPIKVDSALYYAKKAYLLSKKNNDYELGRIAMALGHAYNNIPDYEKSIKYLIEAYDIAQKLKYEHAYPLLLSDLGSTFMHLKDYKKSEYYFNKALAVSKDYDGLIVTYFNLAQLMTEISDKQKSLYYFGKALELARKEGNTQDEAIVYNRFGDYYAYEKDYKKGIYYYEKSMKMFDSTNVYYKVVSLYGLADLYFLSGNYNQALKYCLADDSLAYEAGFGTELSRAQKLLSEIYEKMGKTDLSLYHFKIHSAMQDSIINSEKNNRISYLHVEFETKEMELQLLIMQKEAVFRKKMMIMYLVLGILIITVLSFVIKNVKMKNKKLAFEKEKEVFMKQKLELELHEKQRELLSNAMHINQQKELLSSVKTEIVNILQLKSAEKAFNSLKGLNTDLKAKIDMSDNWSQIKLHFEKVHPDFFNKLKENFPDLSMNELKLCAYTKLKFSGKEIGQLLNINHTSVQMARYRLKKKLGISEEMSFNDYILSIY